MSAEGVLRNPLGEIARRLRGRRRPRRKPSDGRGSPSDNAPSKDQATTVDGGPEAEAITNARFGGEDREGPWVAVHRVGTLNEAHVLRGALEAEDIPVLLRDRSLSALYGSAMHGGVDIQVPRALVENALRVLEGEER